MDQELCHYGVKGMKWGIRRKRDETGSSKPKKRLNPDQIQRQVKRRNNAVDFVAGAAMMTALIAGGPAAGLTTATIGMGSQFVAHKLNEGMGRKKINEYYREFEKDRASR